MFPYSDSANHFLTVEVAQILWQMFMPDHFTQLSHKSDFFQLFVFGFIMF